MKYLIAVPPTLDKKFLAASDGKRIVIIHSYDAEYKSWEGLELNNKEWRLFSADKKDVDEVLACRI